MALPQGATARDRWLELADAARANRDDARAAGDHAIAGQWDAHERILLDNAYGDVPFPDDATPESGFDGGADMQMASADDDPSTVGQFLVAANTRPKAPAPKPLPPDQQAENVRNAREAMSNPMVYAFMRAISAAEGDYDQLVGGKRFKGTDYPGMASGAYQITSGTRRDVLVPQLGLTDFSRDTQDVMAAHLIVSNPKRPLDDILEGRLEDAVDKLRGTWPSLPGNNKQSRTDMATFTARFNAMIAQP